MKALAYKRRSQDSGSGVSEELQDDDVRKVVEDAGGEIIEWLPLDGDKSSWTLDRPSFKRALELLAAGRADTLVVSKLNRLTRRRKHWEEILDLAEAQGWKPVSAEFPETDLLSDTGRMIAGMFIDQGEREYREKRKGYDRARENAVMRHDVHGGSDAPLGYSFTTRGYDKKGKAMRGPLTPNEDAPRVSEAFEARAAGASWTEVMAILGVPSRGGAASVISNRCYLGEARSGKYVKASAHEALTDTATFARAYRKKSLNRQGENPARPPALLSKLLKCGRCDGTLSRDAESYRCKGRLENGKECGVSVQAVKIEPHMVSMAFAWHALAAEAHVGDIDAAALPVFEDVLAEAQAARLEIETAEGLSPLRRAEALTAADAAVEKAIADVEYLEAASGYHSMTRERIGEKLLKDGKLADAEGARAFVREMVRGVVKPCGRGEGRKPIEQRVTVTCLLPGGEPYVPGVMDAAFVIEEVNAA